MPRHHKKESDSDSDDSDFVPPNRKRAHSIIYDDEQITSVPASPTWRPRKKPNTRAYTELQNVRRYLDAQLPNIEKILEAYLFLKDKAVLVEMFERWKQCDTLSEEWVALKDKINQYFRDARSKFESASPAEQKQWSVEIAPPERSFSEQLAVLVTSDFNKRTISSAISHFLSMNSDQDEYHKLRKWIEMALRIPFEKIKPLPTDASLTRAQTLLNQKFYKMENVKEQLLLFLDARRRNPTMRDSILGLVGSAGVGKTSIVRTLAEIQELPFIQINCGGFGNAETLQGHSYTYIGSQCGLITQSLIDCQYRNPIIFLDEFEKSANNSSIAHFFLHVTDPQQNSDYADSFFHPLKINLANVFWVASMNTLPTDLALRDRIFPIYISEYSATEKAEILLRHSVPNLCQELKFDASNIHLSASMARWFVNQTSPQPGGMRAVVDRMRDVLKKLAFLKDNPTIDVKFKMSLKFPVTLDENKLKILLQ